MTESGVNMEATIVCRSQTSQEFAFSKTTFGTRCGAISRMPDKREVIFGRLEALRKELAIQHPDEGFDAEGKFAAAMGLHKTSWSQIKKYERDLPLTAACKAKERWGVSLDWLFYGEQPAAGQLMAKIGKGPIADLASSSRKQGKAIKRKTG